jgi:hypothetical protein
MMLVSVLFTRTVLLEYFEEFVLPCFAKRMDPSDGKVRVGVNQEGKKQTTTPTTTTETTTNKHAATHLFIL